MAGGRRLVTRLPYRTLHTANGHVLLVYEGGRARRKMWWAAALRDDKSDWAAFRRRAQWVKHRGGRDGR